MADENYKRLGCAAPECTTERKARGLCMKHYMQQTRGGLRRDATSCAHCSQPFTPFNASAMYCGSRCKQAAWAKNNPNASAEFYARRQAMPSVIKLKAVLRLKAVVSRLLTLRRTVESALAVAQTKKASHAASLCATCGGPCGYVFGRAKIYCSKKCRRSTEAFKDARKADKSKRKAQARGVLAERFAPNIVFERDGWRCQICGVSTPKSRRGTLHVNAPELDHIQPLSKGGQHTRANTQCACRACNGWKSDRVVVGQIGLFSTLMA